MLGCVAGLCEWVPLAEASNRGSKRRCSVSVSRAALLGFSNAGCCACVPPSLDTCDDHTALSTVSTHVRASGHAPHQTIVGKSQPAHSLAGSRSAWTMTAQSISRSRSPCRARRCLPWRRSAAPACASPHCSVIWLHFADEVPRTMSLMGECAWPVQEATHAPL
jgi:hypothetical protein